jgi:hypothetical protein
VRSNPAKEIAIMEAGSTRNPHSEHPVEHSREQLQEQLQEQPQEPLSPQANLLAENASEVPAEQNPLELAEEQKLIRRLQLMMHMVMQVIAQDHTLSIDDAAQMIADSKKAALAMFPGKELAYDLIWRPRFQRLMRERFRIM